jgi:amino acid transporter
MLAWLSPIWTIGAFDSCVHMSEEASNATRAVPYGILMSIGSCWFFGWILMIVIAATMTHDLEHLTSSPFGQPMAQIYVSPPQNGHTSRSKSLTENDSTTPSANPAP